MNKLYDHQKRIIDEDKRYAGLFLGTGAGKTLIALKLARGSTLVICPKTQKEDRNWEREAQKNDIDIDLTVMSKEMFRSLRKNGWVKPFDTIIVDEAHTVLGVTPNIRYVKKKPIPKTSQLFEELGTYIMLTKPKHLYLCTATLIRSPMTVWGAGKLLGQKWDFYDFRSEYYIKLPMAFRDVWAPKSDNATKNRLARVVQNLGYVGQLTDYFDVPEQSYKKIWCILSAKQEDRIAHLPLEYSDPIVLLGKIHQTENGVLAGDEYNAPEYFENDKIEKILELAIEFPKMIIFAKYRAQIDQIQKSLTKEGYATWTLTGDTKDRGGVIKQANDAANGIFICQAQISAGWELPTYPVMVFASMSYSVVDRIQAEGRILRANYLKKNLYIDLVVKGGIDEEVYKCIENKKDFNERVFLNV